jgi:hypothetical protein
MVFIMAIIAFVASADFVCRRSLQRLKAEQTGFEPATTCPTSTHSTVELLLHFLSQNSKVRIQNLICKGLPVTKRVFAHLAIGNLSNFYSPFRGSGGSILRSFFRIGHPHNARVKPGQYIYQSGLGSHYRMDILVGHWGLVQVRSHQGDPFLY